MKISTKAIWSQSLCFSKNYTISGKITNEADPICRSGLVNYFWSEWTENEASACCFLFNMRNSEVR